jgi:hypothetical protein
MISDEDLSSLIRHSTAYLNSGYRYFGELSDSDFALIDSMASLIMTNYVTYDYEFKGICWTWEYNRSKDVN